MTSSLFDSSSDPSQVTMVTNAVAFFELEVTGALLIADTFNHRVLRWRRGASCGEVLFGRRGHQLDQLFLGTSTENTTDLGPPISGSRFLEGKWDPENFRKIAVGEIFSFWPDFWGRMGS